MTRVEVVHFLGNYSLSIAVLVSVSVILASIAALKFRSARMMRLANWGTVLFAILVSTASAALLYAEMNNLFSFEYVNSYNDLALPLGYKIAAFWAGQAGSMLLWALMLAVMSMLVVLQHWKRTDVMYGITVIVLMLVSGFFAATMLYAANPFVLIEGIIPTDGRGLNPMLQDPAMILHPPILFLGYAGCLVPFAFMMGALAEKRTDNRWLQDIRRWVLASWIFLTVGIVLGSWWAYIELGWGGYWGWDPVENASLLPWLTLTALLHSMMVQKQRGMYKVWNVYLIGISFILCILGTYITRSGVISSVHAFGESLVSQFFLYFLLASILSMIVVPLWRFRALRAEQKLESLAGNEGAFLATNVIMLIIMLTTLIGTLWPLFSAPFVSGGEEKGITLTKNFYNNAIMPMVIVLLALMSMGPLFIYGKDAAKKLQQSLAVPVIVGLVIMIVMFGLGIRSLWGLSITIIAGTAFTSVGQEFLRIVMMRHNNTGENYVLAAIRLLDSNHRRYGGQIVHVGMLLFAIGVVGSSVYVTEKTLQFAPDQEYEVEGYKIHFVGTQEIYGNDPKNETPINYDSYQAKLIVTDKQGRSFDLKPEFRWYNKWEEERNTEVSVRMSLFEDFYAVLLGFDEATNMTAIKVFINPLLIWLWIGSIVMTFGGIYAFLPRLLPVPKLQMQGSISPAISLNITGGGVRESGPTITRVNGGLAGDNKLRTDSSSTAAETEAVEYDPRPDSTKEKYNRKA